MSEKIVYIMGTGRSGTTILEVVLKASEGVDGYGEVTHFPKDGCLNDSQCSCGQLSSACEAWGQVASDIKHSGIKSPELVNSNIESHKHFFATYFGVNNKLQEDYNVLNNMIFERLFRESRGGVLVDSSKYPGRAIALSRTVNSPLHVVAVNRCPYELLSAFQKNNEGEQLPKSYINVFLYYLYVITCMRLASFKFKKFVSVRYEDFVTAPIDALLHIERKLGLDLSGSKIAVENNMVINPGHIVTGNRLRKEKNIIFKVRQREHRSELPVGAKILAKILSAYRAALGF
ncbi:sulfotransferase [bacterium]|nr:sulfotransferase [bacterium]